MNIRLYTRVSIVILATGFIESHALTINNKYLAIITVTPALASSFMYGHIILPWYNKVKQRHATQIQKDKFLIFCQKVKADHANTNIPAGDSHVLLKYKEELQNVLAEFEKALGFKWDNETERESIFKLKQMLEEKAAQLNKMLGLTVGQEAQEQYKDEFVLIAHGRNPDSSKIDRLVTEKYGDRAYKYTTYKTMLNEVIMRCKHTGAPQETLQQLETLNKHTNCLLANALAQERSTQENAVKQEQLHSAEIGNKLAIKDFYQTAQHHVERSEQTVSHFAQEMDRQCRANKSLIDHCNSLLQNISSILASWSLNKGQQTDHILQEVRQQGNATRNAIQTLATQTAAAEHKAAQAEQQAKAAIALAQAAIPTQPAFNPDYMAQGNVPEPSAPPMP